MQISKSTDFALRVLIYTYSKKERLVTQQEIADFFDLSREHLRKIVHKLSQAGYLLTKRGKNGGFSLARPPQEINIGDIITLFEAKTPLINCEGMSCVLLSGCRLKSVFYEADANFIATFRKYTLRDIVSKTTQDLINS